VTTQWGRNLWLAASLAAHFSAAVLWAGHAERVEFLGAEYAAYWVNLESDELWLCWRDEAGKPLKSFARLREYLASKSLGLKFAINAGIYSSDDTPLGLHIEAHQVLRELNLGETDERQFNFYLKPNGVFFVVSNQARIVESHQFASLGARPILACQSGPLLVGEGRIHPAFRTNSTNFRWRSGVGVAKDGRIVFCLSKSAIRFHDFARLFKERLGCDNALYLDGDICAIYLPELGYTGQNVRDRFVGLFAVTPRRPTPPAQPDGK
jgi:uncharacterized protein YigE (DUF2233 family)